MTENPQPRNFKDLDSTEKIKAILAAVKDPVSKELALDFSGVNYNELKDEEKKKIDQVFEVVDVEKTMVEDQERYKMKMDSIENFKRNVDLKSVHKQIQDNLFGSIGLDL